MQIWQQNYDPLGNIWLSSLVALIPILFFFFALIKLKMKGYLAATLTVVLALLVALFLYQMPVAQALVATLMQPLQGQFLRIDTDASLPLASWLNTLGLDQVDAPTTMVRGTPWTPQGMQAFGLMTQAMA